ncbi:MAG TPA: hypothetical protein VIW64_13445 [Pyrinomonadaceae bacterium]
MSTTEGKLEIWTNDELRVFHELGIAPTDLKQQQLVRGIRRAIGRLVAANLEIVKALKYPGSGDLHQAETWLKQVAGDEPPRCELPTG